MENKIQTFGYPLFHDAVIQQHLKNLVTMETAINKRNSP